MRILESFRRRWRELESWTEWIYPYRSLRLTRDGWFFLTVTMAIGFAALNTGHNLFYLIFAMLVSLIIVSGILSERAVRSLAVERQLPREVFARGAAAFSLAVVNRSRRRTIYAVEVRDGIEREAKRRVGFIDRLGPGAARVFHSVWTFETRGRRRFRNIHLVTRFPFGLFEKTRIAPVVDEVVVYPAIDRGGGRHSATDLSRAAIRKHRLGEELIGLRPRLPEDDRRSIHWRVSARAGELMVKEAGEAPDRAVAVFFDNRGPAGPAFETAIERAASLVWQIGREGRRVSFYSYGVALRGLGRDALRLAFTYLAEVEPAAATTVENFEHWRFDIARGGGGVYVTAGQPPALPPGTLLRVA